jgi:hypothetical protein
MHRWITCKKCGTVCQVDGEFPKFFAWCSCCDDYATYDMDRYASDWMANDIENAELCMDLEHEYQ